jgi:hypothetical protein
MVKKAHDLKFSVLVSLILQYLLYCNCFTSFQALSLPTKIKSTITEHNIINTIHAKQQTIVVARKMLANSTDLVDNTK